MNIILALYFLTTEMHWYGHNLGMCSCFSSLHFVTFICTPYVHTGLVSLAWVLTEGQIISSCNSLTKLLKYPDSGTLNLSVLLKLKLKPFVFPASELHCDHHSFSSPRKCSKTCPLLNVTIVCVYSMLLSLCCTAPNKVTCVRDD